MLGPKAEKKEKERYSNIFKRPQKPMGPNKRLDLKIVSDPWEQQTKINVVRLRKLPYQQILKGSTTLLIQADVGSLMLLHHLCTNLFIVSFNF